jgi:hypothetical protein
MGYPERSNSKIKKEAAVIARGVARKSAALSEYSSINRKLFTTNPKTPIILLYINIYTIEYRNEDEE